jgi:hypothetical protein
MRVKTSGVIILLLAVSTAVLAQKNEAGISLGVVASSDQTISAPVACGSGTVGCSFINLSTNSRVAVEGVYTRRLMRLGRAATLGVELPLVFVPGRDVQVSRSGSLIAAFSQSTLFFTPSARVRFMNDRLVSPFFSVGGGLARHNADSAVVRPSLQFGGGLDFRTPLTHLLLRGEVRDFWANSLDESDSAFHVSPQRQHNLFAGGGFVFRF